MSGRIRPVGRVRHLWAVIVTKAQRLVLVQRTSAIRQRRRTGCEKNPTGAWRKSGSGLLSEMPFCCSLVPAELLGFSEEAELRQQRGRVPRRALPRRALGQEACAQLPFVPDGAPNAMVSDLKRKLGGIAEST